MGYMVGHARRRDVPGDPRARVGGAAMAGIVARLPGPRINAGADKSGDIAVQYDSIGRGVDVTIVAGNQYRDQSEVFTEGGRAIRVR